MLENDNQNEAVDTGADEQQENATDTEKTTRTTEEYEAEIAKLNRQLKQKEKKLEKITTKTEPEDFDWGQKAFLVANGIKGAEHEFVREMMAETGKSLDALLESSYFQAELKSRREAVEMAEAIPKGTKRSNTLTRDNVAYWLSKGEMPPNTPENQQLRRDYVNAKTKAQTSGSKFTGNPVVQ